MSEAWMNAVILIVAGLVAFGLTLLIRRAVLPAADVERVAELVRHCCQS